MADHQPAALQARPGPNTSVQQLRSIESARKAAERGEMYWHYCIRTAGWWLMRNKSAVECEYVYGPFTEDQACLAGDVHGVKFDPMEPT